MTVEESARTLPVIAEADLAVLGGGPAGLAAAVTAAERGLSVVLVERYGFMGGVATAAMVTSFCGLHFVSGDRVQRVVRGFADRLLDLMERQGGLDLPREVKPGVVSQAFDATAFKFAADDLVCGAGVQILLHSFGAGVIMGETGISHIIVESKSGRGAVAARMFIDASGDGDLAAAAGCSFEKGDLSGFMQYPTTMFRMRGVQDARAMRARPGIKDAIEAAISTGDFDLPRKYVSVSPQPFSGEWRANATQIRKPLDAPVDGTEIADLSWAEIEGRRQVREFHRFLRNRVEGFEQSTILDTAPQIGVRETRRISGIGRIEADYIAGGGTCNDSVGIGCWPFETHRSGDVVWQAVGGRGYYDIPLNCLLPAGGPGNLILAGRCISASSEALASVRVMGSCFAMGQAAGTLAQLALASGRPMSSVTYADFKAAILADGACLDVPKHARPTESIRI